LSYTVIKVNSLAKRYKIGVQQLAYKTLGESISQTFSRSFFKRLAERRKKEYFWALKDVSFEVKKGEVVGVIGHNGAGKSTLLKILSQITEPTEGTADIYGRVGSLLEVGTGFHMELTGRENVFLSGAIMGMKKADIALRFDEIVAFAAVEKFVDTAVKHYSSGMLLRLAFAVAAHLEPDILLVDEVLAVGDMEFQKKCLNKMENVATEGRTVLFVSHNMGSIKELCQTALVLKNGAVDFHGAVVDGIQHYSRNVLNVALDVNSNEKNHRGWTRIAVNRGAEQTCVFNNEAFEITADLLLPNEVGHAALHCQLEDAEGAQVVHNYVRLKDLGFSNLAAGAHRVKAQMPPLYLKPGVYTLYLKLVGESTDARLAKYVSERLIVDVTDKTNLFAGKIRATILPPVKWEIAETGRVKASENSRLGRNLTTPV
jgi:lipopolysaccharide transport system ATP-binding protein